MVLLEDCNAIVGNASGLMLLVSLLGRYPTMMVRSFPF